MPRTVTAADVADVLREQLEYLIKHDDEERYWRVRAVLMEAFEEPSGTATSITS